MRPLLAWIAVAAAALLALAWFAIDPSSAPSDDASPPLARDVGQSDSADSVSRPLDAHPTRSAAELSVEPTARTATDIVALSEHDALFTVRVEFAKGAPAAGAKVWLFERSARGADYDPAAGFEFAHLERRLAQADESRVCNAEGLASFRQRAGFVVAIARAADGQTGWNVGAGDARTPLDVELVRDFDVDVLVRDSDGRPAAGVQVVLRRVLTVSTDYIEQRTDGTGRATLRNAGMLLSRPGGAWYAQLGLAATDAPSKHLTLRRPPSTPLEFTLPPYGSVELVLGEHAGASGASEARAMLRSIATSRPRPGLARWPTGSSTPLTAASNGSVVFEHVALGEHFEATLVRPLFERTTKFAGPKKPGERVVLRLDDSGAATWTARVVDEQGQPWRGELLARANEGSRVLGERRELLLRPDPNGVVRISAPGIPPPEDARVLTLASLDAQGREVAAGRAQVRTLGAVEDLGEIVMSPVDVLASGEVLDWRDQPVRGARVVLVDDRDARDPKPRPWFAAHTDANGRFELRFALDEPTVALQAIAAGRASRPLRVTAGARDVRLALVWGGEVRLEVANLPRAGECAVNLILALAPSGARFDDIAAHELSARRNSSLVLQNVPAGAWDFVVATELVGAGTRELARVPSVAHIDEQRPTADAGRFDVSALIDPITISASAPHAEVRWYVFSLREHRPGGESGAGWSFTRSTSSLLVPAALAPFDLQVDCPGYLEERFEAVRSDVHAVLRPGPQIEIVLDSGAAELPEGRSYCVALAPLNGAPSNADYVRLAPGGVCREQAPRLGAMRIALATCQGVAGPMRDVRELPRSAWPQIDVSEFGPQRIVVSPTSEAVEAARPAPPASVRILREQR